MNDTPSVYCSTTFVGRSLKQIRLFKRNPSVQAFKEIYPSLTPLKGKIPNWVHQTIKLYLRKKSVCKHYICQPRWRCSGLITLITTLFLPFTLLWSPVFLWKYCLLVTLLPKFLVSKTTFLWRKITKKFSKKCDSY